MAKNTKKNQKPAAKPPAVQTEKPTEPPLSAEVLAEMAAVEGAGTAEIKSNIPKCPDPPPPPAKTDQAPPPPPAKTDQAPPPPPAKTDQAPPAPPAKTDQAPPAKIIWPDGHTICPRCLADDSKAYSTKGKIQYRKCLRGVCRHKFTVIGKKAKSGK